MPCGSIRILSLKHIPGRFSSAKVIVAAFPLNEKVVHIIDFFDDIFTGKWPCIADNITVYPTPYGRVISGDDTGIGIFKTVLYFAVHKKFSSSPK